MLKLMLCVLPITLAALTASSAVAQDRANGDAPQSTGSESADRQAWREAIKELLPLGPAEVTELRERERLVREAAKPRVAPGTTRSGAIPVSLEPGATSPRIVLLHGFVTAIEVLDRTGQPWPIINARQGDPKAIDVQLEGAQRAGRVVAAQGVVDPAAASQAPVDLAALQGPVTANVVTVNPTEFFTSTNLILVLAGASRPISVVLQATEATLSSEFTDRVTLLVGGDGPNAAPEPVVSYDHLDAGDDLRNVLVGQAPTSRAAELLIPLPGGMRAWRDGGVLWLRTSERVISPAPQAAVAMGGTRAYRMPYLPIIVTSRDGRLAQVSLADAPISQPQGAQP